MREMDTLPSDNIFPTNQSDVTSDNVVLTKPELPDRTKSCHAIGDNNSGIHGAGSDRGDHVKSSHLTNDGVGSGRNAVIYFQQVADPDVVNA